MTTRKISRRTKVKCKRIGTPIRRMDPTEPGLAARGVLRASAKQTSQTIVTQRGAQAAGGRRQKAEGRKQKAEGGRQAAGRRQPHYQPPTTSHQPRSPVPSLQSPAPSPYFAARMSYTGLLSA